MLLNDNVPDGENIEEKVVVDTVDALAVISIELVISTLALVLPVRVA